MARGARQGRMNAAFVRESARRLAALPTAQHYSIAYTHGRCELRIKISAQVRRRQKLMAHLALRRQRVDTGLAAMTSRAGCVTGWNRLEGAFLQPECVTKSFWRLGYVLFRRITLRLMGLMTDQTYLG